MEGALRGHPGGGLLAHGVVEDLAAGPAPELGPVHGGVGVPEQRVGEAVGLGEGDPEAAREEDLLRPDGERLPQRPQPPLPDPQRLRLVAELVAYDDELVPPEAGDGVAGTDRQPEAVGAPPQEGVAGGVPPAVVEELEPVEVEEQHPDPGPATGGPGQRHRQPVEEQYPVGETGERVVQGVAE